MASAPTRRMVTFGSVLRDHGPGPDRRPVLELDTLARGDPGDRDVAGEHRAGLAGGVGDREGDHPHAALDVAPDGTLAVHVALVVHELDRGRAVVEGAAPGADDTLAEQRRLEPLVVDVAAEHVGDRVLEDEIDLLLVVAEDLLDLGARRGVADPGVAGALAEQLADVVEKLLVGPVAVDVLLREAESVEALLGLVVVEKLAEGGAVLEGDPEVRVGHPVPEAALAQLQLVDDHVVEEADDVGARGDDEAIVLERPLQGAGAAEPLTALEHQDRLAGPGQVGGRGQAVVAAADDDRVPVLARPARRPARAGRPRRAWLRSRSSQATPSRCSASRPLCSACAVLSLGKGVRIRAASRQMLRLRVRSARPVRCYRSARASGYLGGVTRSRPRVAPPCTGRRP